MEKWRAEASPELNSAPKFAAFHPPPAMKILLATDKALYRDSWG